jgi:tetratricopeptide (TPR) repeat protein
MNRVVTAIESGRCVLAVSGSLLNDADVMLALTERSGIPSMALSGVPVPPVTKVDEAALSRATTGPGGVVVLLNPQPSDQPAVQQIADILQRASHKPTVLVAAQQYNALQFMAAFRGIALGHLKVRGKDFFKGLPVVGAAEAPEVASDAPKKAKVKAPGSGPDAPRFAFVGREDELAALKGMLETGGPIVVSGPAGIGKTFLAEHAVAASGLKRLPDLVLGWGTGYDTLAGRLAEVAKAGGSSALSDALAAKVPPPAQVKAAIEALQAASGTDGQVMVVWDLHTAMGREDDFFRKSRLEMLLEALLTNAYPLRLVFLSRSQPVFHRDHAAGPLRRLPIAGLKGRFLHEIFEAYKAPEFPRDKFGPLGDKIHGHPLAARMYAIAVRDDKNGLDLLEDPKFLKLEGGDLGPLRKHLERKVEGLERPMRSALAAAAHFRLPITGQMLSDFGFSRKTRLQLLADGLLDMLGTQEDKKYGVHPLVRSTLSLRETSDFDIVTMVAALYGKVAENAQGVERVAAAQEANRNAITARNPGARIRLDVPDDDSVLESCLGLIRSKSPNFEMAAGRIREVLANNPSNSDAHLLKIELMQRSGADKESIDAAIQEAATVAPSPEVFQQSTSFYLARRARGKATALLEGALQTMPEQSRLHTRLAALLMRQGRRKDAIDHLQRAMEIDPLLPDAYGLLGTARRDEGIEALDAAESLLREAVRLAPEDPTQIARLVDLLLARARMPAMVTAPVANDDGTPAPTIPALSDDQRRALRDQARELLDVVLKSERKSPDAHVLMATLIRDEGGDLERASWLLKKARKLTEKNAERLPRIILEQALIALGRGDLDAAEKDIRDLAIKDPSNHAVFGALAKVLEARQLAIPAHAELLRARERTARNSIERVLYDAELQRLQALIEAQVAGMVAAGELTPVGPGDAIQPMPAAQGHQRVIRRRKADGAHEEGGSESAESAESAEPSPETPADAPATDDGEPEHTPGATLYDEPEPESEPAGGGGEGDAPAE